MDSSLISRDRPLILASKSPRRKRLLKQLGLPFLSLAAHGDEDAAGVDPAATVRRLAAAKAAAVRPRAEGRWVLGADTLVVLGRKVLGKPGDPEEARATLRLLSGKTHRVLTGFCILDPAGTQAHAEAVTTLVKFREVFEEDIAAYVGTGEPFGKAGSYAIQGVGAFLVEGISGSYTNVVGLPLCAVVKALEALGALRDFPFPPPNPRRRTPP